VKQVFALAAKEAKALSHTYVGTEHLLLALLDQTDGSAAQVLKSAGIRSKEMRREILKELDPNFGK
jgi:ATP-dependent Clp protease ATP-binding subunit ClpC